MRRILLILVAAGSLTAMAANVAPTHPDQALMFARMTEGTRIETHSAQAAQAARGVGAEAATSVGSNKDRVSAEDDSNASIYGALFTTLIVMATIAFRRSRNRKS